MQACPPDPLPPGRQVQSCAIFLCMRNLVAEWNWGVGWAGWMEESGRWRLGGVCPREPLLCELLVLWVRWDERRGLP